MRLPYLPILAACALAIPASAAPTPQVTSLKLLPDSLSFSDRQDLRRVLVLGVTKSGETIDLTSTAKLLPVGGLVKAEADSFLSPQKAGQGVVKVVAAG
ncbi:MAG: hypothetical protein K0Q72_545, partial [Armatimonadetes bacterium]|nr:hypothetical protein [Armatimonadota bacterium]